MLTNFLMTDAGGGRGVPGADRCAPITIDQLARHVNMSVELRGWVYGRRSGGGIVFLLLRDGAGICQCVSEAADDDLFETARHVPQESSVIVQGTVRRDPRAPGGYELRLSRLVVIHAAEEYPIARKRHGIDFLLRHRHLWLRSPRQSILMRIRHTLVAAVRDFFNRRGFILVDTPILSPGAAEGSATLFRVDYFGEEVYLAQTGQLYLEAACMALGKVYCFGPTFRAEKSKTRRHLTEFWMVEPELAFADLEQVMALAEELVKHLVDRVLDRHAADLEFLGRKPETLSGVQGPFARISYTEAVDILHSGRLAAETEQFLAARRAQLADRIRQLDEIEARIKGMQAGRRRDALVAEAIGLRAEIRRLEEEVRNLPVHLQQARRFAWGEDLGGDEETLLSRHFDRPVFITHYPRKCRAFYMKADPGDPRLVLNFDLLAPEGYGEIVGGSQREDDLSRLVERMQEEKMNLAPYQWYLDLRRYGSVTHGGFGLGIERFLSWLCGLDHVREAIAFPRMLGRINP